MAENKFVQLHPHDNVIVCCRSAQKGEQILKYGASIGSATEAIKTGQHVHLHNMKSDYIASHTRHTVTGE